MATKIINHTKAPAAVGTYSQGVYHNGVYYFSGQIGINPETSQMPDDFDGQLQQVLANIDALLSGCNLERSHIIKTSIFLCDLKDFDRVNKAYLEYFKEPFPARSCIQAARLPKDALVEIEVIAAE